MTDKWSNNLIGQQTWAVVKFSTLKVALHGEQLNMNVHLVASPAIVCALFQVEVGNPNVVWSASEDGTLRQHDFREGTSCPPAGSSHQECRNVLVRLITSPFIHFYVLDTSMRTLFVEL